MPQPHEAMLWEPIEDDKVHCFCCAHECRIAPGKLGICRVRRNVDGALQTLNYETVVAMNPDPIEKKPLFHFLPGTRSMSVAAPGCNFQCDFCQNWQISQSPQDGVDIRGQAISPGQIVAAARQHGCESISYTYTEPTIFFELANDTAGLAKRQGLGNCFVSNGFMTERTVEAAAPWLDAINVDLKAFRDETYRDVMHGRLEPVLKTLRALVAAGVWVEVTTLVVPQMNDSEAELGDIAGFIADELGSHVPWHVSRFHGDYRMDQTPATPIATLETAARLGKQAGLKYVYCGNVPGQADERTHCPACGEVVIDRVGFMIRGSRLVDGACPDCGEKVDGVWTLWQ